MSSSNGKKVFGREDILAAKAIRKTISIDDVPGLDGHVLILELKRSEYTKWLEGDKDSDSKLVARVLCDEAGNLLFDPDSPEDLVKLEESLTYKQMAHIAMKGIIENSANAKVAEKNLQASLNTLSNSA